MRKRLRLDASACRRAAGSLAPILLASCLLAGCTPGRDMAALPAYQPAIYRLGVGDQLRVITFGEERLTGDFRVSDNGTIAFPLIGPQKAVGLTTEELGRNLAKQMQDRQLLRDPSLAVEVTTYSPVAVLGEVSSPGEYPYRPGMTMLTAVAVAGGFTPRAEQNYSLVIRQSLPAAVEGKLTPRDYVAPGDVIKVYQRPF